MEIAFLENKYNKWYYNIINNARHRVLSGYSEKHHIIPKSLGGDNSKENLVKLTAREHFVCHLLLTKITSGHHQILMKFAVGKFIQIASTQQRLFTSWEYKKIRKSISEVRTGRKHSAETKEKISLKHTGKIPWNKGIVGITHSLESNRKRSETLKGIKRSIEFRQKVSDGKKGHNSGMTGKQHSEDTKLKMKQKQFGIPKGPQKRVDICPHCLQSMVTYRHIKFCKK